jgi:hypothetical protein
MSLAPSRPGLGWSPLLPPVRDLMPFVEQNPSVCSVCSGDGPGGPGRGCSAFDARALRGGVVFPRAVSAVAPTAPQRWLRRSPGYFARRLSGDVIPNGHWGSGSQSSVADRPECWAGSAAVLSPYCFAVLPPCTKVGPSSSGASRPTARRLLGRAAAPPRPWLLAVHWCLWGRLSAAGLSRHRPGSNETPPGYGQTSSGLRECGLVRILAAARPTPPRPFPVH